MRRVASPGMSADRIGHEDATPTCKGYPDTQMENKMTTTTPGSYGAAADRTDVRRKVWTFTETKLGYKTSEFLMMLIFAVGVIIAAYASSSDTLSPRGRLALRKLRRRGVHPEPRTRQARHSRALRAGHLTRQSPLDEERLATAQAHHPPTKWNGPGLRPGAVSRFRPGRRSTLLRDRNHGEEGRRPCCGTPRPIPERGRRQRRPLSASPYPSARAGPRPRADAGDEQATDPTATAGPSSRSSTGGGPWSTSTAA